MPQTTPARIAFLPGNILIDDPASEWMAGAVQVVLQEDLVSAQGVIPLLADDASGTYLAGAKQVLRTTITQRNGHMHAEAVLTDNSTQKDLRLTSVDGPGDSGVLPLLNELANRLDRKALLFSTKSNQALQAYVAAATSTKLQDRIDGLNRAISLDPSFGLAYVALADTEVQTAPQAIPALLQAAKTHEAGFSPFDRARLMAFRARYSRAPLQQQITAYRKVLSIAPNASDALVQAGSLSFLTYDAAAGTQYMQRALALNPRNPAIQRAFAEGLFEVRRFREAEQLLVGLDSNPAVLPELAVCVLMQGDVPRANAIAERLFASIQNQDIRTLFRAVWLKLSGQPQKAVNLLSSSIFAQPNTQAIAFSELSIWQMMANDFPAARRLALQAQHLDPRPTSFAHVVALLSSADGPANEWKQQVDSAFAGGNPQLKQLALGYGFFLGHHYPEAGQIWNDILNQSGGADLRARAMLAASLLQQGKNDQARQIQVQPFVPDFGDLYASVSFFEMDRDLGIIVR